LFSYPGGMRICLTYLKKLFRKHNKFSSFTVYTSRYMRETAETEEPEKKEAAWCLHLALDSPTYFILYHTERLWILSDILYICLVYPNSIFLVKYSSCFCYTKYILRTGRGAQQFIKVC
jgi:hypothetical protein